ncbi:MAG: aspartyl/asparaginyl beta-hydroxylase domain-containing protein [Rhizomicrobium sp.]
MPQIYDHLTDAVRRLYDLRIHTPAVLDIGRYFPDASQIVPSWKQIRSEALSNTGSFSSVPRFHELMSAQAPISANDGRDWRVFVLKAYGLDIPRNIDRCPATAELIARCPSILSASFSFLAPGKHIPPHRGPFRGIVRFHLGLSVPLGEDGMPGAILTIDGVEHRLGDGDCLLWDDTYSHEVHNPTDEVRVALLLDVWRSEMPTDMVVLSHLIVASARLAAGMRVKAMSR